MKAKKLVIRKLYGYINKSIEFNEDINLLVGINGSGKTSVLNIINWLLSPSLANLGVTEFQDIHFNFEFNDNEYTIDCHQSNTSLTFHLIDAQRPDYYRPLSVRLTVPPKRLTKNKTQKEKTYNEYLKLGPDKDEVDTFSFVFNEIPKPVVIGLDRNLIIDERADSSFLNIDRITGVVNSNRKPSPLSEVKRLTNRQFSIYKSKLVELSRTLHNSIFLSSFEEITNSFFEELENVPVISLEQVESLHRSVENFIRENKIDYSTPAKLDNALLKIENYFMNLRTVLNEEKSGPQNKGLSLLYLANISQFKRLRELIKEFEEFERKSKEHYKDLKIFLDTTNKFLSDSSKQLIFQKDISELSFNVFNKDGRILARDRDIENLSSGEKQILTLLTYLRFHERNETIFIIDEPELSLHPKWQDEFLEAVKAITPKNTQIIIATHSPAIVGENEKFCKVLLPYD